MGTDGHDDHHPRPRRGEHLTRKRAPKKKLNVDELLQGGMIVGAGTLGYISVRLMQDYAPFFVGHGLREIRNKSTNYLIARYDQAAVMAMRASEGKQ